MREYIYYGAGEDTQTYLEDSRSQRDEEEEETDRNRGQGWRLLIQKKTDKAIQLAKLVGRDSSQVSVEGFGETKENRVNLGR